MNEQKNMTIINIPLANLKIHPKNIRKSYEDIDELAASIKEKGILQNLTVVPDPNEEGKYLVVVGNRRLTAARQAGIETVPCRIDSDMSESEQALNMLVENMQRSNLKVSEEAAGVQMCLSDYGFTIDDIADKTGLSQSTVRHRANLAKLDQKLLQKKESDGTFQINLSDLTKLEKVSSVKMRNKILREAKDSRDLAWKAQSAADEEKRAKVIKKLTALAKKEHIEPAPEGTVNEMYGNKWDTVKSYDLTNEVPEKLYDGSDKDGLFYLIQYRTFKLIRKAKKIKRELSDDEKREREIAKKKRQLKEMYKDMYAQMGDFARSIINGKIDELKDTAELMQNLWSVLLYKSAWISRNYILCVLLGKEIYEASEEERTKVQKQIANMPMHQQMICVAYWACRDIELTEYDGSYAKEKAEILKNLYQCLVLYGFSFAEEKGEYTSVMDGTHPLYTASENAGTGSDTGMPSEETEEVA